MKKYFLLFGVIIISCKKSQTTNPVTGASAVLLTSYSVEAVVPHPTIQVYVYAHDANNRVTTITFAGVTVTYTYNSNGNFTSYGSATTFQDYFQFTYDASGVINGGTEEVYSTPGQIINSYSFGFTITNNQVSQLRIYNLLTGSGSTPETTYDLTYDNKNNLVKRVELNSAGAILATSVFTFGTHYSPQFTHHLPYNLSPLFDDDTFNTNEILTKTTTYPNSVADVGTYQYTYNGQYPITALITDGSNSYIYGYQYSGL